MHFTKEVFYCEAILLSCFLQSKRSFSKYWTAWKMFDYLRKLKTRVFLCKNILFYFLNQLVRLSIAHKAYLEGKLLHNSNPIDSSISMQKVTFPKNPFHLTYLAHKTYKVNLLHNFHLGRWLKQGADLTWLEWFEISGQDPRPRDYGRNKLAIKNSWVRIPAPENIKNCSIWKKQE